MKDLNRTGDVLSDVSRWQTVNCKLTEDKDLRESNAKTRGQPGKKGKEFPGNPGQATTNRNLNGFERLRVRHHLYGIADWRAEY